jgi:hypothetical protein
MLLGHNTIKMIKVVVEESDAICHIAHLSLTWTRLNIQNSATCTTRRCASASLDVRLENPSPTCFHVKQVTKSRCVLRTVFILHRFCRATNKPKLAWFWGPNQETIAVILSPKSLKRTCRFWGPNQKTTTTVLRQNREKPSPSVLRLKQYKPFQWFWGQTTDKLSTLVLRVNKEIRTLCLLVHGTYRTQRHPTFRSPGHRLPDLCDHLWSSTPGLLLLPWFSSHLSSVYHETSKHDSPHE